MSEFPSQRSTPLRSTALHVAAQCFAAPRAAPLLVTTHRNASPVPPQSFRRPAALRSTALRYVPQRVAPLHITPQRNARNNE